MDETENMIPRSLGTAGAAAGGLLAGLLASSCCLLPLAFVTVGVGGAWTAKLTSLAPYQPYFLGAAAALIGWGLYQVYRKPQVCTPGTVCANPKSSNITKSLLWAGAVLTVAAFSVDVVLPLIA